MEKALLSRVTETGVKPALRESRQNALAVSF